MENSKQWYMSKGFWLGVVIFVGNGLFALKGNVSPETFGLINSGLGVLVIIVRSVTGKSISFGKKNN